METGLESDQVETSLTIANPIIGYNVIEEIISSTQLNRDNLIRAFQVAFEQTRETTEALVNEIQTIKE